VRLKFTPNEQLTLMAAIFNGDPAGPGSGNPVARDLNGLAFRLRDPPLLLAEINYAYNQASIEGSLHQEGAAHQTSKRQSTNNISQHGATYGAPRQFRSLCRD
jgi:hypothetical protein